MRQFEVCRNPNSDTASYAPYLLVLQSDLLEPIPTCVVAPLISAGEFEPAQKLNPTFEIEGETYILSTAELAGVPRNAIGEPVYSLQKERDTIIGALDLLFLGW